MAFQGLKTVLDAFRLRRSQPPGVYELANKVKTLIEQGERDAARRILQDALERFPGHSSLEDINHFLGQGRLQETLAGLRRVVEQARKVHVCAARAFADTDNRQKAIEFITAAFRQFPECHELHLILGEIYLRQYLEDQIPEDGQKALESLERACRLDPRNSLPRKYLAGFYARIGCFGRAAEHLTALDGKGADEEEQRYIQELRSYCSRRASEAPNDDVGRCLTEVWERRQFAVDCRDWALPKPPAFGRRHMKSIMVPFALMELTAKMWVELPGVAGVVVQNQIRSNTFKAEGVEFDPVGLEHVVREVAEKSAEACHRMGLGHVRHCELKSAMGLLSIHMFADTWAGLLFKSGSSMTQVRTVTQQCLDLMAEAVGEIYESNS